MSAMRLYPRPVGCTPSFETWARTSMTLSPNDLATFRAAACAHGLFALSSQVTSDAEMRARSVMRLVSVWISAESLLPRLISTRSALTGMTKRRMYASLLMPTVAARWHSVRTMETPTAMLSPSMAQSTGQLLSARAAMATSRVCVRWERTRLQ